MSELTLLLLRIGFLILMWSFVFAIVYALRSDLFGTKVRRLPVAASGRSADSGLVIRDDYTSTHHARLMLWDGTWMIQDLDSTNGTLLSGKKVGAPTAVPLNTPVSIGTTTFELRR